MFSMRVSNVKGMGRYGTLHNASGYEICKTIEREYLSNQKNVSSVPLGVYALEWRDSPKQGKPCLYLVKVGLGVTIEGPSQRTVIMFHVANGPSQLLGCIAPVSGFSVFGDEWGGRDSGLALAKFERAVKVYEEVRGRMPSLSIE